MLDESKTTPVVFYVTVSSIPVVLDLAARGDDHLHVLTSSRAA